MNTGGLFVLILVTCGCIFLLLYLPIAATNPDIPPVDIQSFTAGTPDYEYEEQICPAKLDWNLATNERDISNAVFAQSESIPDPLGLNNLVYGFGQFIAHEIAHTQLNATGEMFTLGSLNLSRAEFRFPVPGEERREPKTTISTFIDASTVYGDYLNTVDLRNNSKCELKTSTGNLLPVLDSQSFLAGDDRNTENALLNAIHTLWMREHNRLCGDLTFRRPHWTEDEKYWKARQVVIAKMQHILYTEWLPAVLGSQIGLLDTVQLRGTGARIASEFGIVGFRFGHSIVSNMLGNFTLLEMFFNPTLIQTQGIEPFLNAALNEPAQKVDAKVVDGLRNIMFGAEDLVVRNLFRARDLTMGRYQDIALCYGITPIDTAYTDPLVGMLLEPLVEGSFLPLTIATIVSEQFRRLQIYDPHFYTKEMWKIGDFYGREILKTKITDIILKNTNLKITKTRGFYV